MWNQAGRRARESLIAPGSLGRAEMSDVRHTLAVLPAARQRKRPLVALLMALVAAGMPRLASSTSPCDSGVTPTCSESRCTFAPAGSPCWHPDLKQCRGDFCCLTCDTWKRYLLPDVATCTCEQYKAAQCFAPDCVPCSTTCFPHNQTGAPLGFGVLCTNSSSRCEPCCQNKHSKRFCHLMCPCDGGGADCAPPPRQGR